jgi:hypothetical protein
MSCGSRAYQEKPEAQSSCSEQTFQTAFFAEEAGLSVRVQLSTHPGQVLMPHVRREKKRAFHTRDNRFRPVRIHEMTRDLDALARGGEDTRACGPMGGTGKQTAAT